MSEFRRYAFEIILPVKQKFHADRYPYLLCPFLWSFDLLLDPSIIEGFSWPFRSRPLTIFSIFRRSLTGCDRRCWDSFSGVLGVEGEELTLEEWDFGDTLRDSEAWFIGDSSERELDDRFWGIWYGINRCPLAEPICVGGNAPAYGFSNPDPPKAMGWLNRKFEERWPKGDDWLLALLYRLFIPGKCAPWLACDAAAADIMKWLNGLGRPGWEEPSAGPPGYPGGYMKGIIGFGRFEGAVEWGTENRGNFDSSLWGGIPWDWCKVTGISGFPSLATAFRSLTLEDTIGELDNFGEDDRSWVPQRDTGSFSLSDSSSSSLSVLSRSSCFLPSESKVSLMTVSSADFQVYGENRALCIWSRLAKTFSVFSATQKAIKVPTGISADLRFMGFFW